MNRDSKSYGRRETSAIKSQQILWEEGDLGDIEPADLMGGGRPW